MVLTHFMSTNRSSVIIAQVISFLSGFVVSFVLNRHWVFAATGRMSTMLARYAVLAGLNVILTSILIDSLMNNLNIPIAIAKVLVMGCVALWNYVIFNKVIFKSSISS